MRRWGLAALLVVGLLTLLFRPPALLGQSGGPFIRATCSQINSPTTGESVCFNSTRGEWQTWTGSAWVAISGASNSVMNGVLFVTEGTRIVPARDDYAPPPPGFFGRLRVHVAIGQAF